MSIAIDFGTSNTVIARWNPVTQQAETLSLPGLFALALNSPPLIPSLAYVEDATIGEVVIGQQVRDRGLDLKSDPRFFRSFKRGIGAPIQGFVPEIDGENLSFERVGKWFLTSIVNELQSNYPDVGKSLTLTVPVDSFEAYRHWLGDVCQSLPVEQVRMLDEPTAAALGYQMSGAETILAIDFGGGTLDLSLVQLPQELKAGRKPLGFILKWGERSLAESGSQRPKTARVIAKAGQNLGGTDIDNWIADYFAVNTGIPVSPLTIRLAEKLKIQLSTHTTAKEVFFDDETLETYELELDRDRFESILKQHKFLENLDGAMTQVLQQGRRQGVEVGDIDAVLLVGGTVQIPAVQAWVEQYFDTTKIRRSQPFEAIAHGALQLSQGVELKDFLYHSYGIRFWDRQKNAHNWHEIIKTGQSYPMSDPVEITLGASVENQPSIELIIGELGQGDRGTEVYFDGDRLITRSSSQKTSVVPLNDRAGARTIAQLTPPGYPGSDRVKVQFWVGADRSLRITVEDLLANQTLLENRIVAQLS